MTAAACEGGPPDRAESPAQEASTEAEVNALPAISPKVTKHTIRVKTWAALDKADVLLGRKPRAFRLPRFKGDLDAARRLAEVDEFKQAKVIKVALDKALESVRFKIIEAGKELIAGAPGLRDAVFLHVKPPAAESRAAIESASTRFGIARLGKPLEFNTETQADLIVMGAVAVDRRGHRVGKGEGYSDLEVALLRKLGAIKSSATIVAVVHDLQVYNELPESLFETFDVPLDVIVTPTQLIHVDKRLPRPELQWNLLSNRRVNRIPIVKKLLEEAQSQSPAPIVLKEVDSDVEGDKAKVKGPRKLSQRRREKSVPERRRPPRNNKIREASAPPVTKTNKAQKPSGKTIAVRKVGNPKPLSKATQAPDSSMSAEIQKPAPGFSGTAVVNSEFQDISLKNYLGKYVVLLFYPLDFTYDCATEIIAFSRRVEEFRKIDCEIIAASCDSQYGHLAWTKTPVKQGGLGKINVPLLADKSGKIAKDYGVYNAASGVPYRGLFIIDENQDLRQITINDLGVGRSVDETLRLVQAFQYTDKHGEGCPANWKPGSLPTKPDSEEADVA